MSCSPCPVYFSRTRAFPRMATPLCIALAVVLLTALPVRAAPEPNRLYVSLSNNKVVSYDITNTSGSAVLASSSVFASNGMFLPAGLAFGASGELYVANFQSITRYTSSGDLMATWSQPGMDFIRGLAIDSAGSVYAATNGNRIARFTASGNLQSVITAGLDEPRGLAFDSSGKLYAGNEGVLNSFGRSITQFAANGTVVSSLAPNQAGFGYLTTDSSNNLYAIGSNPGGIYKFDATRTLTNTFALLFPTGSYRGIAVDSFGNIYAANPGLNQIEKYNSAGQFQFLWTTPANPGGMTFFASTAVPEIDPAGLGSVLALVTGALGLVERKKRRRS